MKRLQAVIVALFVLLCATVNVASAKIQLGAGYGREFRGNTDLEQFEAFLRLPIPYSTQWGEWNVDTGLELAGAAINERGAGTDETGRFSLMPYLTLSPHKAIRLMAGLGAGFMAGETEFTDHNLGGSFCLVSKLGLQLVISDTVGLEYTFYHQSNAGIYDYNASLNMNQLALTFHF